MNVVIHLFGRELLSLHVGFDQAEDEYADDTRSTDGVFLGFTPMHAVPDESGIPYREGWE